MFFVPVLQSRSFQDECFQVRVGAYVKHLFAGPTSAEDTCKKNGTFCGFEMRIYTCGKTPSQSNTAPPKQTETSRVTIVVASIVHKKYAHDETVELSA